MCIESAPLSCSVEARAAVDRRWGWCRLGRFAAATHVAPLTGAGHDRRSAVTEGECAADRIGVDLDRRARLEATLEQRPGERILDQALDRAAQRPRAVDRVEALAGNDRASGGLCRGRTQSQESVMHEAEPIAARPLCDLLLTRREALIRVGA